jgi:hypothetical protein
MSRGGSIKDRQAAKEYNMAQIVDILRKNSGKPMSSTEISNELHNRGISIHPSTAKKYCVELVKEYSEITSSTGVGYTWAKEEAEFYDKKAADATENKSAYRKKSPVMRNGEGYSDPTAGVAIRNAEGGDPYARLGEVWTTQGQRNEVEYFLILSDWGVARMGLPLYCDDFRSRLRVKVEVCDATLYGDATNFRSKPSKYFDTYMGNIKETKVNEILDKVFSAICDPYASPVVVEKAAIPNTIVVDGRLYTEADVRSKLDTITTLNGRIDAYTETVEELDNKIKEKESVILDKESQIGVLTNTNNDLMNANNDLRSALVSAKKSKPIVLQVDGEIYNEDDLKDVIRARNTVRVGDKVYKASDICELLEAKNESAPAPDKAYVDKVVAMATIYKQFFDSFCRGMEKGVQK